MEEITIENLYKNYRRKIQQVSLKFRRYCYNDINWNNHVIGIKGERGVGKTTLICQHIKENFKDLSKALYVSLDNIWFSSHSLTELVEDFTAHGGTHIFLDEVHKYPKWQTILKNLCDDYPELHIAYTSSSMLQIDYQQGDMSRRQRVYTMRGLSFREFLEFEGVYKTEPVTIEELIGNHVDIAAKITAEGRMILPLFEKYLQCGYYPFYKDDVDGFSFRLQDVVNQVLESDLPSVEDVNVSTIMKAKRMLMVIAERVPFQPKMSELYRELETTRDLGLKILNALKRAGLVALVTAEQRSMKSLSKPDKILMGNTNLMYSLTFSVDKGAMREAFFFNQLSSCHEALLSAKGDFLIDRKYVFEVGGKGKNFKQIADIENSYLAVDDIDMGHGARIPLWMFGLLY